MMSKKYNVAIILCDGRQINLVIDSAYAPKAVEQFVTLARGGFYDGTIFHRVIDNFMIQTGGYRLDGNTLNELKLADTLRCIEGEFASNGYKGKSLPHTPGVISMARTSDKNSASSQFFICSVACPHLDGEYTSFGYIADGQSLSVVQDIARVQTTDIGYGFVDFPVVPITIRAISVVEV